MNKIILKDDDATNKFGQLIASKILALDKRSIEIHLEGDLGSGKTFLTRSIIKNCGWSDHVKSPTYTLCDEYETEDILFLHVDLYRLTDASEIQILDLDRPSEKVKVIIIEWPEIIGDSRTFDLKVSLSYKDKGREALLKNKLVN